MKLTEKGAEQVCRDVEKTGEFVEDLTGQYPRYLRPPYGDWNELMRKAGFGNGVLDWRFLD